jgi:hypothetical protein
MNSASAPMERTAARQFRVAWLFLLLTAASGVGLRLFAFHDPGGLAYSHLLHGHSHIAFLGWVFNAFFALAFRLWFPAGRVAFARRLFWILQIANVGMFAAFLAQGYAAASIALSTMHMVAAVVFALSLWRLPTVAPSVRPWLRAALAAFMLSAVGPLTLGPLAALDLRNSALYPLSVYWYLHFQYNGWFILFPIAWVGQTLIDQGRTWQPPRWIFLAFIGGMAGTFLVSALWLRPPASVHALAALAGTLQLVASVFLLGTVGRARSGKTFSLPSLARVLVLIALTAFFLKAALQIVACLPALVELSSHRYITIAFMHGVFLGVVLPAVFAIAHGRGWLADGPRTRMAFSLFATGFLGGQYVLIHAALNWSSIPALSGLLLAAAITQFIGLAFLKIR